MYNGMFTMYSGLPHCVCAKEASARCLANPKSASLRVAYSDDSDNSTFAGFKSLYTHICVY